MFCPNCGHENEEDARFCRSCGAPLPAATGSTETGAGPAVGASPTGYPVHYVVEEHLNGRNRLTTFFRLILATSTAP